MYKNVIYAVLYNSSGSIIDRKSLNPYDINGSLINIIGREWSISDGDTIKIESELIKYL